MNTLRATFKSYRYWIVLVITLVSIACCAVGAYEFTPWFRLDVNRALWDKVVPSEYCMEVDELSSPWGKWRWAVHVRDGQIVTANLLDVELHRDDADKKRLLNENNLSVEGIFTVADQFCVDEGYWTCSLDFDPRFHYPIQVDAYERMLIRIENFTPCGKVEGGCYIQ